MGIEDAYRPYPFTKTDLSPEKIQPGVEQSLGQFYRWRDEHPEKVADYLRICVDHLDLLKGEQSLMARTKRLYPPARLQYEQDCLRRELRNFSLWNMFEIPNASQLELLLKQINKHKESSGQFIFHPEQSIQHFMGQLNKSETLSLDQDVAERLRSVYRVLPEHVVAEGAMGKIARTMLGVGAIAAYGLIDASDEVRTKRGIQVLHGAAVYGAVYALVDDTLHDGRFLRAKDQDRLDQMVRQNFRKGLPFDTSRLPDNPVIEELCRQFNLFTKFYPPDQHADLYAAAESMYWAQRRDMELTMEKAKDEPLEAIYPDLFIKAALTRVIANMIAQRDLDPQFFARGMNMGMSYQLRDDLDDYFPDRQAGRVTAFTHPNNLNSTNPLYDMFALDAYLAEVIYGEKALLISADHESLFWAQRLIGTNPKENPVLQRYLKEDPTDRLQEFFTLASRFPEHAKRYLVTADMKLRKATDQRLKDRDQTDIDPRTFIADRIPQVNRTLSEFIDALDKTNPDSEIVKIVRYAIEAGGKRVRPALTLMLAESLGIDYKAIEPLLITSEFLHTASLLFDDLPSQDNSATRRNRPTAHTVFGSAAVELAGIYMLMKGIGAAQKLKETYPSEIVSQITTYTTETVAQICHGQNLDLHLVAEKHPSVPPETILEMYHLKTSLAIEASLVPLMMLQQRSETEIDLIRKYSHHAGLVFQMIDDLLDLNGNDEVIGKDTGQDKLKINLARALDKCEVQNLVEHHLNEALLACQALPFNTNLLQNMVRYFASRKK